MKLAGKFNIEKLLLTLTVTLMATIFLSLGPANIAMANANDDRLECRANCKEDRAWCEKECEKEGTCDRSYCTEHYGLSCLEECGERWLERVTE